MRTTISVDDRVLKRAKERALKAGVTLSELVEQALRRELDQVQPRAAARPFKLITFGGGLNDGYDWHNLEDQLFEYPKAAERGDDEP